MTSKPAKKRPPRPLARPLAKGLAIALAGLLLLVSVMYALMPWMVSAIAPRFANQLGVDTIEVAIGFPRLNGVAIHRLRVASAQLNVLGENAWLGYSWRNIVRGRANSLTFERLDLAIGDARASDPDTDGPTLDSVFNALPVGSLEVNQFTLRLDEIGFVGEGAVTVTGSTLALTMDGIEPQRARGFSIAADLSQDGNFNARFAEQFADQFSAQDGGASTEFLSLQGSIVAQALQIKGDVNLSGYALTLASSVAGLPAATGDAAASFETTLPWPLPETFSWRDLVADVSSATINWTSDRGDIALDAVSGSMQFDNGRIAAQLTGSVRARIEESRLTFVLPSNYSLHYEPGRLAGGSGVKVRIRKSNTNIAATLRSFSVRETPATSLDFDADISGTTGTVRLSGRLTSALTIAEIEPDTTTGRATYAGKVQVGDQQHEVQFRTAIEIKGDDIVANGTLTSGIFDEASVQVSHNLKTEAGRAGVSNRISINQPLAAVLLPGWDEKYDLDSGNIDAAMAVQWQTLDAIAVDLELMLSDCDGHYDDYRLSGIDGRLKLKTSDMFNVDSWSLAQTNLDIRSIDVGFPIDDVILGLAWAKGSVKVNEARASLLGGQGSTTPFEYDVATGNTAFDIVLQNIELAEMLALEGDDIKGSGLLDGRLPVIIEDDQSRVTGGTLNAQERGGAIRLTPSFGGSSGQSGLDFALVALQDFTYSSLACEVDYAENGDLDMAVHLEGYNPAVENGRPIRYNLNINENIPVLLESLRLQDQVTSRIEKKIGTN